MSRRVLNREQLRQLDRRASDEYGVSGLVLMENAGRGVADKLCELAAAGPVAIFCGPGNNGDDGFVLARHLDLRGIAVKVALCAARDKLSGDAATNFRILEKSGMAIYDVRDAKNVETVAAETAWIVDALLGTGARGEPRAELAAVIDAINRQAAPVLAIDLPSGLDCDTGITSQHTIRAAHTCTLVAAKPGFDAPGANDYTGQVHVLDIGAPRKLLEDVMRGAQATETPRS